MGPWLVLPKPVKKPSLTCFIAGEPVLQKRRDSTQSYKSNAAFNPRSDVNTIMLVLEQWRATRATGLAVLRNLYDQLRFRLWLPFEVCRVALLFSIHKRWRDVAKLQI